jgi:hypothetical protein
LGEADAAMSARFTPGVVRAVTELIPSGWSANAPQYADYLLARLAAPRAFPEEALRARSQHV